MTTESIKRVSIKCNVDAMNAFVQDWIRNYQDHVIIYAYYSFSGEVIFTLENKKGGPNVSE